MSDAASRLALIVGSGFEQLGLEIVSRSPAKTPFGEPSSPILTVAFGEMRIPCLARHGEAGSLPPHEVNYRANLWLLWQSGVRRCIGINTVGAIAAELSPGELVVPDQLIDYTWGRAQTFSGTDGHGLLHIDFTQPFDRALRAELVAAAVSAGGRPSLAGTYGVTQGPRLETAAEIDRLARDGCSMVGMTAMPEASLARELGIAYAICAVAVNWAAGRAPDGLDIHSQFAAFSAAGMVRARRCLEFLCRR
jgi:5'-methylthioinosine phosphorylase